jgi:hypothetical protein
MELHGVFDNGWLASTTAEIAHKPIFFSSAVLMLAVAITRFLHETSAATQTGATDAALKDRKDKDEACCPE